MFILRPLLVLLTTTLLLPFFELALMFFRFEEFPNFRQQYPSETFYLAIGYPRRVLSFSHVFVLLLTDLVRMPANNPLTHRHNFAREKATRKRDFSSPVGLLILLTSSFGLLFYVLCEHMTNFYFLPLILYYLTFLIRYSCAS